MVRRGMSSKHRGASQNESSSLGPNSTGSTRGGDMADFVYKHFSRYAWHVCVSTDHPGNLRYESRIARGSVTCSAVLALSEPSRIEGGCDRRSADEASSRSERNPDSQLGSARC